MIKNIELYENNGIKIMLIKWWQGSLKSFDVDYYEDNIKIREKSDDFPSLTDARKYYNKLLKEEKQK